MSFANESNRNSSGWAPLNQLLSRWSARGGGGSPENPAENFTRTSDSHENRPVGRIRERSSSSNPVQSGRGSKLPRMTGQQGAVDTLADEWEEGPFRVTAASIRGSSHRRSGLPRQDAFYTAFEPRVRMRDGSHGFRMFIAVADGVSAAEHAATGAVVAGQQAYAFFVEDARTAIDETWFDQLFISVQAAVYEKAAQNNPANTGAEFATALLCLVIDWGVSGTTVSLARVGDSSVWLVDRGRLTLVSGGSEARPNDGSHSIVPIPSNDVVVEKKTFKLHDPVGIIVCTDGVGDFLEQMGPSISGSDRIINDLFSTTRGLDLAVLLESEIQQTTSDDMTAVSVNIHLPNWSRENR